MSLLLTGFHCIITLNIKTLVYLVFIYLIVIGCVKHNQTSKFLTVFISQTNGTSPCQNYFHLDLLVPLPLLNKYYNHKLTTQDCLTQITWK